MRKPKVHLAKRGARRTACGIKVEKTRKDTNLKARVTCPNCKRTEQYSG